MSLVEVNSVKVSLEAHVMALQGGISPKSTYTIKTSILATSMTIS